MGGKKKLIGFQKYTNSGALRFTRLMGGRSPRKLYHLQLELVADKTNNKGVQDERQTIHTGANY